MRAHNSVIGSSVVHHTIDSLLEVAKDAGFARAVEGCEQHLQTSSQPPQKINNLNSRQTPADSQIGTQRAPSLCSRGVLNHPGRHTRQMSLPFLIDKGVQALPGPVFADLGENARKAGSIGGRRIARRTSKPGLFTVILVKIL